jgi:hypothetical protein
MQWSRVGSFIKHEDGPRRPEHQFGPGFARENVGQPIIIAWLEVNNQGTSIGPKKKLGSYYSENTAT